MAKKIETTPKTESVDAPKGVKPVKKAAAKKTVKRKAAAPKASTGVEPKADSATPVSISSEDIALRAYYLGEQRAKLGLPGDSANDWIEAERQLKAEAQAKS